MSDSIYITLIVCATIVLLGWMANRNDKKGGGKNGKS